MEITWVVVKRMRICGIKRQKEIHHKRYKKYSKLRNRLKNQNKLKKIVVLSKSKMIKRKTHRSNLSLVLKRYKLIKKR